MYAALVDMVHKPGLDNESRTIFSGTKDVVKERESTCTHVFITPCTGVCVNVCCILYSVKFSNRFYFGIIRTTNNQTKIRPIRKFPT